MKDGEKNTASVQMTEKVRLFLFFYFNLIFFFYKHYKICIEASLINIVFGKGPIFSLSLSPFFSLLMKLCQAKKKNKIKLFQALSILKWSELWKVAQKKKKKKKEKKMPS